MELGYLKERCADHENCAASSEEIERLTKLADDISKERKSLQEQVVYLQVNCYQLNVPADAEIPQITFDFRGNIGFRFNPE